MSVIDTHTHIRRYPQDVSEKWAEKITDSLADVPYWRDPSRKWRKGDLDSPYEDNLEDMDRNGVDRSILLGSYIKEPSHPEAGWAHTSNDYIAEAQNKHPDRFIGFASVDPRGGDRAVREIDRAINELGLRGIGEFTLAYCGVALDDEILDPIYKRCEELARERGIPLSIHTGFTFLPWTYMEKQDPALLWHVLEKFPELKISVDHAGLGGTWDKALHLAVNWPNIYLDFTFLRSTYPPFKIMEFLQHAKWAGILDRCLWGTDYPWAPRKVELDMYRSFPAETQRLGVEPVLTKVDIEAFLGGNAEKFLGLK